MVLGALDRPRAQRAERAKATTYAPDDRQASESRQPVRG